ncbi:MAG TPA: DUF2905 domain-containing protein [Candidatus Omnitrophota bacterium]|nr:DUF2905 domain-containing protein [Candidatus Omnitrophota bacterium]HPN88749.1 DUF2905 domain-containing protein [Candidatus Omnitrophota bacterium]
MELGKTLITIGVICIFLGVILVLCGKITWLGKLPGDIFIKKENFSFYFPLTTCLVISAIISAILWLWRQR